ncbi:MAG: hypothetical protein KDK90_26990 [Leptospiraceae bacterium]|nr:hypothetical protein [Leptospiraceae bacterium]
MKNIINKLIICFSISFLIFTCSSAGERTVEGRGYVDKRLIRGYLQFQVWQDESRLGYIFTKAKPYPILRDKVWKGKENVNSTDQILSVTYSSDTLAQAQAQLRKIGVAEGSIQRIVEVTFRFIYFSEYVMEDPELIPKKANYKNKPYIAAALKVDRVDISLKTADGAEIKTEADLKKYNLDLGGKIRKNDKENSLYAASKVFVGYKLFEPDDERN